MAWRAFFPLRSVLLNSFMHNVRMNDPGKVGRLDLFRLVFMRLGSIASILMAYHILIANFQAFKYDKAGICTLHLQYSMW
jgi:hypothetical protein